MTITVRALTVDDWKIFSTIRLQALKECPGVYASNYAKESLHTQKEWQGWLRQKKECVFGLFENHELVGIAGVFTHGNDKSGATGVLGADYIEPGHRGQGLMRMLYESRINWGVAHLPWKKLVISHRKSNEASRRANQQAGFRYTHTDENRLWPDGSHEDELWYELDLEKMRNSA